MNQKEAQQLVDDSTKVILTETYDGEPGLIQELGRFVDGSDFQGTVADNTGVVGKLQRIGYQSINDLPLSVHAGSGRHNLALCIIGNFISSNGLPPPNVMARFVSQHAEMKD